MRAVAGARITHYESFVVGSGLGLAGIAAFLWTVLPRLSGAATGISCQAKPLLPGIQKSAQIPDDDDPVHRRARRGRMLIQVFQLARKITQHFDLFGIRPIQKSQEGMDRSSLIPFSKPLDKRSHKTTIGLLTSWVFRETVQGGKQDRGQQGAHVIRGICCDLQMIGSRPFASDLGLQLRNPLGINSHRVKRLLKPKKDFSVEAAASAASRFFQAVTHLSRHAEGIWRLLFGFHAPIIDSF